MAFDDLDDEVLDRVVKTLGMETVAGAIAAIEPTSQAVSETRDAPSEAALAAPVAIFTPKRVRKVMPSFWQGRAPLWIGAAASVAIIASALSFRSGPQTAETPQVATGPSGGLQPAPPVGQTGTLSVEPGPEGALASVAPSGPARNGGVRECAASGASAGAARLREQPARRSDARQRAPEPLPAYAAGHSNRQIQERVGQRSVHFGRWMAADQLSRRRGGRPEGGDEEAAFHARRDCSDRSGRAVKPAADGIFCPWQCKRDNEHIEIGYFGSELNPESQNASDSSAHIPPLSI